MKQNKYIITILGLGIVSIGFLVIGLYNTTLANITMLFSAVSQNLAPRSFPVEFIGGGNSYVGAILISEFDTIEPRSIDFNGYILSNCIRKIKGHYFNAARGIGLVPLHEGTYGNLEVTGGLYTACRGLLRNEVVGSVSYTLNGISIGTIVFGNTITNTEISNNSYNPNYSPGSVKWTQQGGTSLQLFGRFFDSMLGIGTIDGGASIIAGDVTNLIGSFTKIYIQGHIGLGQSIEDNERGILSSTLAGTRTILNTSDEVNTANIINVVRRNATQLCRNQQSENQGAIMCMPNSLTITSSNISDYLGRDIVVRNANVFIDASAYPRLANSPISLFIDNGHLILDNRIDSSMLTSVDNNGFSISLGTGTTQGIYLNGNFIIDGLIFGGTGTIANESTITSIPFRTYIHGRFAALNTYTSVSDQRSKHLMNKFGLLYTDLIGEQNETFHNNSWSASMEDIFSFTCSEDTISRGIALSGFNADTQSAVTSILCTPNHEYPLMIVERNWPTLLLKR